MFPDDDLELTAEAAFGADLTADPSTWVFTDLSPRVVDNPITISRGVLVGTGTSKTGAATGLTLLNTDGWLTPQLPTSPYWPYVDVGTPVRLSVRTNTTALVTDTFSRTVASGWGTSDDGQTWTGTTNLSVAGNKGVVSLTAPNTTRRTRVNRAHRDIECVFDVSIAAVSTGASTYTGTELRSVALATDSLFALLEFGVGGAVRWNFYQTVASVSTVLAFGPQPGLTYTAGTVIRCRVQAVGATLRARAWLASGTEPQDWALTATVPEPVSSYAWTGFYTWLLSGNTNSLPNPVSIDNVSFTPARVPRFEGYITDVRPTFLPQSDGTTFSTVQIDLGGVGTRLERRSSPAFSPMRRSIQLAPVPPVGYWPLEDDEGATYAVSAYPGGSRMVVVGPAVFGFDQGTPTDVYLSRYGTKPLVSVAAGAKLTADVPLSSVVSEWAVSVIAEFYVPEVVGPTEIRVLQWWTAGTFARWAIVGTSAGYQVRAYNDAAGTVTTAVTSTPAFVGQPTYTVEAEQNAGNIDVRLYVNDLLQATGSVAGTLAPVSKISVNPDQANTTASLTPRGIKFLAGHVRVVDETSVADTPFYSPPETGQVVTAKNAWYQEPAHRRVARQCAEERVPFTLLGNPGSTGYTLLNAQQDGSFTDLITTAAESESGAILAEAGFGYAYLARTGRYNQSAALVVDLAVYRRMGGDDPAEVLVPKLDARAANYWTVQRWNGAEGSYAASETYRDRRGTINEQKTLDVLLDSDTDLHAQWRVHTAVDAQAANYPNLTLDLAANPGLIDAWLGCAVGSRVQRTNQPTIAGLGVVDQVIDGITETIGPRSGSSPPMWTATLDCSPATVWDTGVWDATTSLWQPTNTTITALLSTTSVSFTVNSHGEPWITGAVSLRLQIDAEVITATNISGSGSTYTFTVTRSVNGVVASHASGAQVVFAVPTRWAL